MELGDDDLSTLANSLADLLGAPVTVEDTDSTVLAYSGGDAASGHPQTVDEARIGTILGRQVPARYRTLLREAGVYARIRAATGVVYVELPESDLTPRAVVAVRQGDELIGSIWAAMPREPDAAEQRILESAVPVVARHIARERSRTDSQRRRRGEAVEVLLRGGIAAKQAALDLGIRGDCCVVAVAPSDPARDIPARLVGALTLHLDTVGPRSACAMVAGSPYAVVGADETQTARIFADFLGRSRDNGLVAGVGRVVHDPAAVARSRTDADAAVRAAQAGGHRTGVVTVRDVLADVLTLSVAGTIEDLAPFSPLTTLEDFDRAHGSELVASVRAYLLRGGDVAEAAAALHVHPNTLRNRLRRAAEACGVDVEDADTRLVLALHLRARRLI